MAAAASGGGATESKHAVAEEEHKGGDLADTRNDDAAMVDGGGSVGGGGGGYTPEEAAARDEEVAMASLATRQQLRRLVLAGSIAEANDLASRVYPGLLERPGNQHLVFALRCQQFIEMVRAASPAAAAAAAASSPPSASAAAAAPAARLMGLPAADLLEFAKTQLRPFAQQHQAHQQQHGNGSNGASVGNGSDGRSGSSSSLASTPLFDHQQQQLQGVLGLLAYPDPLQSPLRELLDLERREEVAEALNATILATHGLAVPSKLEVLLGQLLATQEHLAEGCGEPLAEVPHTRVSPLDYSV